MTHSTDKLFAALAHQCILPILRFGADLDGMGFCEQLLAHDFKVLEITLSSDGALTLIQQLAEAGHCVGAGTLHTPQQAEQALNHGAQFLVSPGLNVDIVKLAQDAQVAYFPGVFTPTEVLAAYNRGLRSLKLFPASTVGASYLKHFSGPFPGLHWLPTGGIAFEEVESYLAAGALVVGQGTRLVSAEHLASGNWGAIARELRHLQGVIQQWQARYSR
jgi:2-dehydro-3-deoxyphosphogluconate aldolase / (4S)-4-hydroxy-2-oxoglutarate aldolase